MTEGQYSISGNEGYFLKLAYEQLSDSIDGPAGVGAVIIHPDRGLVACGANQLPPGILNPDESRTLPGSAEKEYWSEHAERIAVYRAAREGVSLDGCTMHVTLFPCHHCARAIILSGIKDVVCPVPPDIQHKKFGESWKRSVMLLLEAKVAVYIPSLMQPEPGQTTISLRMMSDALLTFDQGALSL